MKEYLIRMWDGEKKPIFVFFPVMNSEFWRFLQELPSGSLYSIHECMCVLDKS